MPDFLETLIGRPGTVRTYKSLYKHHIFPHATNPLTWDEKGTRGMVKIWEGKGLAPRTIQTLLRLLASYVKWAGGPDINIRQLSTQVGRTRQDEELVVLNKEQAQTLIDTCKREDPEFYPILLLGLHAGLRRGEVFGLTCADVDVLTNRIRVAHSYDGPTKNGKTRFVPMSKELGNAMISARNLTFRPVGEPLFEKMDPNPRLHNVCEKASLNRLRFHDLRHTFATLALESEKSPKEVQMWLGHSNVSTTLAIYWNVIERTSEIDFF
jgi:integrase